MAMAFFQKTRCRPKPNCQQVTARRQPQSPASASDLAPDNSAKDILDLLELELQAMIRQLERAAQSVASGAQSTADTLSAIRERTDDLTGRTSSARTTADTFSQAADKFTESADGIGTQVRDASRLADQASAAPHARPASMSIACANPPPRSATSST